MLPSQDFLVIVVRAVTFGTMEMLTLSRSLITARWTALVLRRDMAMIKEYDTANFDNPSCEFPVAFSSGRMVLILRYSANLLSEAKEDKHDLFVLLLWRFDLPICGGVYRKVRCSWTSISPRWLVRGRRRRRRLC